MLGDMLMDKRMLLPNVGNACRSLFGPVDHEEQRKVLHRELRVWEERSREKWNFDFKTEKPLPGRWEYEQVEAAEEVPEAYSMPQLSVKLDVIRLFKATEAGVPLPAEDEEDRVDTESCPACPAPGPVRPEAVRPASAPCSPTLEAPPAVEELPVSETTTTATQTSPRKRKHQAQITDFFPAKKMSRTEESKSGAQQSS